LGNENHDATCSREDIRRFAEKVGSHLGQDGVEAGGAATLGLDGQCTRGQLHRPASVNRVAAVPMMKDGRCADHRMPREVELFEEVEDVCPPMMLRSGRIEKMDSNWRSSPVIDAIWVLLRPPASGKTVRLFAAVGRRGEHVDELELHRQDPTRAPAV
jgi:hypothetical protein